MNQSRPSQQSGGVHRFAVFGLLLVLLVSLLPGASQSPVSAFALAKIQPELRILASQQPDRMVPVIVQKVTDGADLAAMIQKLGGAVVYDLYFINALAADLPAGALMRLAGSRDVGLISLDGSISGAAVEMTPVSKNLASNDPFNTYLDTLGVTQLRQTQNLTGAGITIAILDSGVANNPDFGNRLVARVGFSRHMPDKISDKISYKTSDNFGHGTHVAGIVAGDGSRSGGLYGGIAPDANLVSVKIGGDDGRGYESDVVAAMQWVLENKDTYNIRVVNMSINSDYEKSYHESFMDAAAEILWFNSIVVVTSSGNADSTTNSTIKSAPANDPFLITVGATTEEGDANRRNDSVASYSASGKTLNGQVKPEIVAPGTNIVSVLADTSSWKQGYPERLVGQNQYFRLSGTSMATPMVSAAAALMLQANPNLTPDDVKCRLIESSSSLGGVPYLDIQAAVNATRCKKNPNQGIPVSSLLTTGEDGVLGGSVNWNSVNWNSVNWNSVNWNSVNWNSVNWNSVNWNSVNWNSVNWGE